MTENSELISRIEQLERSCRRLRMMLALLLAATLVATLGFSYYSENRVRAEGFELIDNDGRVRGRLELEEGGPGLHLLDESGRIRVSVVQDADQGALFIRDPEGQIRVGAAQFAHGGGGFALHGPEGKGAAVLYLKGQGSLRFIDAEGNVLYKAPE